MLKGGLVSVTFRNLRPHEVVDLVAQAGLSGIEWGGDVHVPHGDVKMAREVARMTRDAGLETACYGSYYRLGAEPGKSPPFSTVLESALELGAPSIRVWPGTRGSAEADADYRAMVAEEALELAERAAAHDIALAYEFHANSLTDTAESAADLLEKTQHPGIHTLWQPISKASVESNLAGLKRVKPRLLNVHVFHWEFIPDGRIQHPLKEGGQAWLRYLKESLPEKGDRYYLLEFVRDQEPRQFLEDAATLRQWLAALDS